MAGITLKETTQTRVGDVRVGCGNLWEREYALPDGTTATGMSARLSIADDVVYVGAGSELEIGGVRYRVTEIEKFPNELGLVTLLAS